MIPIPVNGPAGILRFLGPFHSPEKSGIPLTYITVYGTYLGTFSCILICIMHVHNPTQCPRTCINFWTPYFCITTCISVYMVVYEPYFQIFRKSKLFSVRICQFLTCTPVSRFPTGADSRNMNIRPLWPLENAR